MSLLKWLDGEQITRDEILTVKPKPLPPSETCNEDIVLEPIDEIDRGQYCTICNMLTTGLPCRDVLS